MNQRVMAACAAVLLLAGCSGSESAGPPPPAPSSPAPPPVAVTTDPCSLLTDAEAGVHVGVPVTGVADDMPGVGRGCRWEAPGGAAYVSVNLNTPAFPDVSTARRTLQFKELSGQTWLGLARDGLRMKRSTGRSWGQMMLAANTPMLLKAGLVNGDTQAGMLASGQVVGVIDDLPTCEQLVDRIIDDAVERLSVLPGFVQNSKDALA